VGGIGVVVNPHARGNRHDPGARVERMRRVVGDVGVVRLTESVADLERVATEFRGRGIEILAVCGGDGSDHCTLTAFDRIYGSAALPLLLPLRAGSINYVANDTGGRRGSPEQVLGRVARDHRRGKAHVTCERDLLRVNGDELAFVLGFGTAVNFLRAYYAREHTGRLAASWMLARAIGSALVGGHEARALVQPVEADVDCDGERLPFRRFTWFFAATVEQIALGFRPTYLATRKRGYFHVVGGPIAARRLIRRAVRIRRGFPTGEPDLYDSIGARLSIRFRTPTAYMLDGDVLDPCESLEVGVGRRVTIVRG
jgi:diacylglycerol kinase family enzyme